MAYELLNIAVNNNYIPAINLLINLDSRKADEIQVLLSQGVKLGSPTTVAWHLILYANRFDDNYKNTPEFNSELRHL